MLTAGRLAIAIGNEVLVRCEGWIITMIVRDAKQVWGNTRLEVGSEDMGWQWVNLSRVIQAL